jgi:membrane fusion protein, multidrug efflux system
MRLSSLVPPLPRTDPKSGSSGGWLRGRWLGAVILCGILAAVAATGCNKTEEKKGSGTVTLFVVSPTINYPVIDYQDFTGRLDAYRTVDIKARVTGYLVKAPFKEGDIVKEGDLLFEIDRRPFKAALDAANAQVEVQQANIELAKKTYERDLESNRRGGSGIVSDQQLDQDRAQQKQAEANLRLARANLETARINYDFTVVNSPITGRVSRRYVDPGNDVNADNTMLTEIVTINPVYAYFDVDERTYLELQKRKTPHVFMRLVTEEKFSHTGDVDFIDNKVNPNAGTLRMRGVFDCVQGQDVFMAAAGTAAAYAPRVQEKLPSTLWPGLFCRVRVPVGDLYRAVLVPDAALQTDQGKKFVYVVTPKKDKDGKPVYKTRKNDQGQDEVVIGKDNYPVPLYQVEYRPVETGQQLGEYRVIKEAVRDAHGTIIKGLSQAPGEWVVTKGQQRVRLNANAQEKQEVEIKTDDTHYQEPESPLGGR